LLVNNIILFQTKLIDWGQRFTVMWIYGKESSKIEVETKVWGGDDNDGRRGVQQKSLWLLNQYNLELDAMLD
jgi:hypothetical protein